LFSRSGNEVDHRYDVAFEPFGEPEQLIAALLRHAFAFGGGLRIVAYRLAALVAQHAERRCHVGDFIVSSRRDLGVEVAARDSSHAALQSGNAAHHAAADIEPAEPEGGSEAGQGETD